MGKLTEQQVGILKDAYLRIRDKENWCAGDSVRVTGDGGVKYCVTGALHVAAGVEMVKEAARLPDGELPPSRTVNRDRIARVLSGKLLEMYPDSEVARNTERTRNYLLIDFNDAPEYGHPAVIEAMEKVLADYGAL